MPNQFTTTTTTGYGNRIANSFVGVFLGILLFFGSFVVLYWNEGRVDLSNIAKTAIEINSSSLSTDPSLNGKLVSTTGIVGSNDNIGDNLFLNSGNFIAVKRTVEMYSWKETKNTTTHNNTGGSSTTNTTYTYSTDWQDSPGDSSTFQYSDGHQNPQKSLDDFTGYAKNATVGVYSFDPSSVALPTFTEAQLNSQNTTLSQGATVANDSYLFISNSKNSTLATPQVGDLRISYFMIVPGFNGTIFGALNGNSINAYVNQNNISLYRLFAGTRAQGISMLHTEYNVWLWILRAVGFFMMWFGLLFLFGPIVTILDILPIFGGIAGILISLATLPIALILTIVTILVSMIIHSIIALVIALIITIVVIISFFIFLRERKKKINSTTIYPPSAPTPPTPNQTITPSV